MSDGSSSNSSGAPKKFVFRLPKVPPRPGLVPLVPQAESASAPLIPQEAAPYTPTRTPTPARPLPVPVAASVPSASAPGFMFKFKAPDPPRPRHAQPPLQLQQPQSQWKSTSTPWRGGGSGQSGGSGPRKGNGGPRAPVCGSGSNLKQLKLQFRPKPPTLATTTVINTTKQAVSVNFDDDDDDDDCQIIAVSTRSPNPNTIGHNPAPKPMSVTEPQPSSRSSSSSNIAPSSSRLNTTIGDFPEDDDDEFEFDDFDIPDDIETNITTSMGNSNSTTTTTTELPSHLDPHREIRRETNETFHALSKLDPFCAAFTLRELIPLQYEISAGSIHQPLPTRIEIAHSCLTYIERLVKSDWYIEHGQNPKSSISKEAQDVMDSFERMVRRILMNSELTMSPSDTEEVTRLLDRVWTNHVGADVDFRSTRVLNLVLGNSPQYLEDMLAALMKKALFEGGNDKKEETDTHTESTSPSLPPAEFSALLRLCQSNADNFKRVFETMHKVWRSTRRHPLILQFTTQLLESYAAWSKTRSQPEAHWIVYPTRFHPLLNFLTVVEEYASSSEGGPAVSLTSILECNVDVQSELLRLINALLEEQEEDRDRSEDKDKETSMVLFFLYTNPILVRFITESQKSGQIGASRDFPYLWKAVTRDQAFKLPFFN